ncbi:hypothetical protein [Rubinisphaera brasiliensis]|nr:hypothetical protein [Rubinisphaera brasiliensis]
MTFRNQLQQFGLRGPSSAIVDFICYADIDFGEYWRGRNATYFH